MNVESTYIGLGDFLCFFKGKNSKICSRPNLIFCCLTFDFFLSSLHSTPSVGVSRLSKKFSCFFKNLQALMFIFGVLVGTLVNRSSPMKKDCMFQDCMSPQIELISMSNLSIVEDS